MYASLLGNHWAVTLAIVMFGLLLMSLLIVFFARYKKCPSNKIMVIYGMVGKDKDGRPRNAVCLHGGAAFVKPVIQSYKFLDLTPLAGIVEIKNALVKKGERLNLSFKFTVAISVEPGVMQAAAERLLGLESSEILNLATDIALGQFRLVAASKEKEEILADFDKFLEEAVCKTETEFRKIGLRIININVTEVN